MVQKEIIMKSEIGLQAPPATKFVKLAVQYKSSLTIEVNERKCNGKTLLGIMSLGIGAGDTLLLTADGPDEQELIDALVQLNDSKYE